MTYRHEFDDKFGRRLLLQTLKWNTERLMVVEKTLPDNKDKEMLAEVIDELTQLSIYAEEQRGR